MILVEAVLGNVRDPDWKARVERAAVDSLTLDQWEAQKNRFRKHTDGGLELAVALDRRTHFKDGDVLVWDEAARRMVVAHIHLNDVMVVRLTAPSTSPSTPSSARASSSATPSATSTGRRWSRAPRSTCRSPSTRR